MTALLIAGELILLVMVWALWSRLRGVRANLDRLEGRFIETRVRSEETLEGLQDRVRALGGRVRQLAGAAFDPDMSVAEALAVHPDVHQVFTLYHLKARDRGPGEDPPPETLREAAEAYGVPVEELLQKLEATAHKTKKTLPILPFAG